MSASSPVLRFSPSQIHLLSHLSLLCFCRLFFLVSELLLLCSSSWCPLVRVCHAIGSYLLPSIVCSVCIVLRVQGLSNLAFLTIHSTESCKAIPCTGSRCIYCSISETFYTTTRHLPASLLFAPGAQVVQQITATFYYPHFIKMNALNVPTLWGTNSHIVYSATPVLSIIPLYSPSTYDSTHLPPFMSKVALITDKIANELSLLDMKASGKLLLFWARAARRYQFKLEVLHRASHCRRDLPSTIATYRICQLSATESPHDTASAHHHQQYLSAWHRWRSLHLCRLAALLVRWKSLTIFSYAIKPGTL